MEKELKSFIIFLIIFIFTSIILVSISSIKDNNIYLIILKIILLFIILVSVIQILRNYEFLKNTRIKIKTVSSQQMSSNIEEN